MTAVCLLAAACGANGAEEPAPTQPTSTEEAPKPSATTGSEDETGTDMEDIDWATVDLTTLDWERVDVTQIDFQAIQENPTVVDLDSETVARIVEAMPADAVSSGNATLTIGDSTWEFDSFGCAFGHEATQSDVYSFSSNSFGEHEGARVQMQANIRDTTGQGRFEGDDLDFEVFINDIDDFENPSIDWDLESADSFTIDGDTVTVQGTFDDGLTETEQEAAPGSLEATCGSQSRR